MQPFCYPVYFLKDWYALPYPWLYLLYIPADIAMVQAKQKAGQSVGYVQR
jgi:hypothetical protein